MTGPLALYEHPSRPDLWLAVDDAGMWWEFPADPIHKDAWELRERPDDAVLAAPRIPAFPKGLARFYWG